MKNHSFSFFKALTFVICLLFFQCVYSRTQEGGKIKIHIIELLDFHSESLNPDNSTDEGYTMKQTSNVLLHSIDVLFDLEKKMNMEVIVYKLHDEKKEYEEIVESNTNRFSIDSLNACIQKIQCKGDIVIVLYSGHGFTFPEEPISNISYPNLMLNYDRKPNIYVPYQDILLALQAKSPKMVLSVINACQNPIPKEIAQQIKDSNPSITSKNYESSAYVKASAEAVPLTKIDPEIQRGKELFYLSNYANEIYADRLLSVELISCSKGEFTNINRRGGHFVRAFANTFSEKIGCKNLNHLIGWEEVAFEVAHKTKLSVEEYNSFNPSDKHKQTPQCKVVIKNAAGKNTLKELNMPSQSVSCDGIQQTVSAAPTAVQVVERPRTEFFEYSKVKAHDANISHTFAIRLTKLANTYREAKCFDCSIEALTVSIEALKKYKDVYFEATAYENLGLVYMDKGNSTTATYYLEKAFDLFKSINACGSATTIYNRLKEMGINDKKLVNCQEEYESIEE